MLSGARLGQSFATLGSRKLLHYCFICTFSVPTFDIPETVACQDTKLSLSCEAGSLLHIKSANFGRRVQTSFVFNTVVAWS